MGLDVSKFKISIIEEDDGGWFMRIEWDDNDPDLSVWSNMNDDERRTFFLDFLRCAAEEALRDDSQDLRPLQ